jgi:hypothetical protein
MIPAPSQPLSGCPRDDVLDRLSTAVLPDCENVHGPRYTIELNICLLDLVLRIDAKQVEALHGVLANANLRKDPVPDDVTTGHEDTQRLDILAWVLADASIPFVTASSGRDDGVSELNSVCQHCDGYNENDQQ